MIREYLVDIYGRLSEHVEVSAFARVAVFIDDNILVVSIDVAFVFIIIIVIFIVDVVIDVIAAVVVEIVNAYATCRPAHITPHQQFFYKSTCNGLAGKIQPYPLIRRQK